jgi:hypothetical protein
MPTKPVNRSDYISPQEKLPVWASINVPSHDGIERLAQTFGELRGEGDGGAEDDWLEAERPQQRRGKGQAA